MGVVKGERKESKVEFDNTYFKVFEDAYKKAQIDAMYEAGKITEEEYNYILSIN